MSVIDRWTSRKLHDRSKDVRAVVIHTTGIPSNNAGDERNLERILAFYDDPDGLQPHYCISVAGDIYRIAREDQVAQHCGRRGAEDRLYLLGYGTWSKWHWPLGDGEPTFVGEEYSGYRQWRDEWFSRGVQSPLELATGGAPNDTSIGVELQQPDRPTPIIFTEAQYVALVDLLSDIWMRRKLPMHSRASVLTHYDVSPMRRSVAAGSWDPGRLFSYRRIWDLLGRG